jgi:hypothetical protein
MNINEVTTFLGWCSVINFFIYALSAVFILVFKNFTASLHSKITGVDISELPLLYFKYLGNYKIGIIIFNFVPYFALKVMN